MSGYKIVTKNIDQYLPFIAITWLRTLRRGNDYFKLIEAKAYYDNYGRYINNILGRPNIVIHVAVLSDDPDVALGWSVSEGANLHYVYVKGDFRKIGIGNSLIPNGIKTFSHITLKWLDLWKNKDIKFNPFS